MVISSPAAMFRMAMTLVESAMPANSRGGRREGRREGGRERGMGGSQDGTEMSLGRGHGPALCRVRIPQDTYTVLISLPPVTPSIPPSLFPSLPPFAPALASQEWLTKSLVSGPEDEGICHRESWTCQIQEERRQEGRKGGRVRGGKKGEGGREGGGRDDWRELLGRAGRSITPAA
jgi:hypothetical protein